MANIYTIARAVGVSPSTVSRALREGSYCSPGTRERVLAEARRQGYAPSDSARSLRRRRTDKILFCIPDIYNPFYFGMVYGASEILDQFGYYPILCHTRGDPARELAMLDNLRAHVGDGMIFVSFDFSPRLLEAVNACGMPVVLTNDARDFAGERRFDCVYVDTFEGVRMATRHLIAQGHARIGYIGGDLSTGTGRERCDGYLAALGEAGLPPAPGYGANGGFTLEGGRVCAQALLARADRPTAVVAANDLMALGVMEVCRSMGLSIPEDVCLVGMDDTTISRFTAPPLSSVVMREEEIGRMAATLLVERIQNMEKPARTIRLAPDIALRASSLHRR